MIDPREPVLPLFDDEEASNTVRIEADLHDGVEASESQVVQTSLRTDPCPEPPRTRRQNVGGRPKSKDPKVPMSIRLDREVVEKFRATGPGWQSRINAALRKAKP